MTLHNLSTRCIFRFHRGESATIFVIAIATPLSDIITKVLKDNGIGKTSKTVNEELVSLILKEDLKVSSR